MTGAFLVPVQKNIVCATTCVLTYRRYLVWRHANHSQQALVAHSHYLHCYYRQLQSCMHGVIRLLKVSQWCMTTYL